MNSSSLRFQKTILILLGLLMMVLAEVRVSLILRTFDPAGGLYKKDIFQEYLLSKAVLAGVPPYLPLPELAQHFMGDNLPENLYPHPTPHPPTVILLALPLGFFSFQVAALVWFVFELVCLMAAAYGMSWWFNSQEHVWRRAFFIFFFMLAWRPWMEELMNGQLGIFQLALLVGAWLALRKERDWIGGALLGITIALKLIAWPLAFFLLIRRRWRAVFSIGLAFGVCNLLALLIMGWDQIFYYYTQVSVQVMPLYRAFGWNLSLSSLGWRLFDGTGSPGLIGFLSDPLLFYWPLGARVFSVLIPAVVFLVALWRVQPVASFDIAYAMMLCVAVVLSPISWIHYFVLAAISIVVVVGYLRGQSMFGAEPKLVFLLGALFFCWDSLHDSLPEMMTLTVVNMQMVVPVWVSLWSLLPTFLLLVVFGLLERLDNRSLPNR